MRLNKVDAARDKSKSFRPVYPYSHNEERISLGDQSGSSGNNNDENYMNHNEKISQWIESLPIFETSNYELKSYCYYSDFAPNWEEVKLEDQLREEMSAPMSDEILHLSSNKTR
ncbi:ZYRO0F02002p [Zygosaccharomyces rouxii]|uniref:ZYRO0F02002p n=2 Tax=Zygosaccharomyces rouxii TaxID=4956 RepID=C5DX39_ZYGRC|nr:uncharacterized protein ZYRO0F02002g [Zygosaccharomyces rouxii]KAH9199115.1 hypothetical protein LQ764DRAFT_225375 [Zygosaccharomyces rouxii]CAR28350.1 ZYRO0F02002p [Zygosaccharomyces rouxii]